MGKKRAELRYDQSNQTEPKLGISLRVELVSAEKLVEWVNRTIFLLWGPQLWIFLNYCGVGEDSDLHFFF